MSEVAASFRVLASGTGEVLAGGADVDKNYTPATGGAVIPLMHPTNLNDATFFAAWSHNGNAILWARLMNTTGSQPFVRFRNETGTSITFNWVILQVLA